MLRVVFAKRKLLASITRIELASRYSGFVFGFFWVFLQPALYLSMLLFLFSIVLDAHPDGMSRLDFALFVACGLVPYLALAETVSVGTGCLKQNMHLVRNVFLPIELIPVRTVAVSLVSQAVSLTILVAIVTLTGRSSLHLSWLPLVVAVQAVFLVGIAWPLSVLGIVVPDISNVLNLFVLFLLFTSPIGYRAQTISGAIDDLVYANPLFYFIELYRDCILYGRFPSASIAAGAMLVAVASLLVGSAVFRRFKRILADYA